MESSVAVRLRYQLLFTQLSAGIAAGCVFSDTNHEISTISVESKFGCCKRQFYFLRGVTDLSSGIPSLS